MLKEKRDDETLYKLMRKIYDKEAVVQERIGFIVVDDIGYGTGDKY